jgi:DNA (cytosine-5)-methyltransferase 1
MPPFVWKENALKQVGELKITAKKRSYDTPKEINEYLKANKNGKTIREIAESLDLPKTQVDHYFRSDKSQNGRLIKEDGEDMFTQQDQHGVKISYHQKHKTQTKRIYNDYGLAPTLPSRGEKTGQNSPIINSNTSIRRLTPVECMRLQGFPDNHNEFGLLDGKKVVISDTQRYKQAGNAVTVDVVAAVARKIRSLKLEIEKE